MRSSIGYGLQLVFSTVHTLAAARENRKDAQSPSLQSLAARSVTCTGGYGWTPAARRPLVVPQHLCWKMRSERKRRRWKGGREKDNLLRPHHMKLWVRDCSFYTRCFVDMAAWTPPKTLWVRTSLNRLRNGTILVIWSKDATFYDRISTPTLQFAI